uniref:Uncharacterized protein n=1 Tax=Arundo donax TaxID=35708 RepID=A0A0A9EBJ9_ARUDO
MRRNPRPNPTTGLTLPLCACIPRRGESVIRKQQPQAALGAAVTGVVVTVLPGGQISITPSVAKAASAPGPDRRGRGERRRGMPVPTPSSSRAPPRRRRGRHRWRRRAGGGAR